jgi:CDP-glucose 4,6-dehydratase
MNSFWKDRNAFVTGATGFVGAHVARALVEQGARVVCLQRDALPTDSLDLFDLRHRVTVINGKVEDHSLMERIINEFEIEAVFHLAAQAIVGVANRSPISTFESNIRGTYSLLEACRTGQTVGSVVIASSDKAYGTHEDLPYREDYPLLGLFPYDASKACADILARSFAHTYGTPVAVTRSANIYGPGDMNLSRIIPGTIVSVLRDEPPVIRSDGTPIRDFVYIDDVVRGYMLIAEKIDEVRGEAFNFSAGEPVRMIDLVELIIKLSGRNLEPRIMLQSKIEREIDAQYLSAEKVESRLAWRAKVDLDEGLRSAIEWYRDHMKENR